MSRPSSRHLIPVMLCLALPAAPVAAQANVEARVGRLESEMRAVQRKVFPGGAASLQPEIVAAPTSEPATGAPASNAVIDLTGRVASLEQQMATLTGQVEQNGYQLRTLREQFEAYRRSTDQRLAAAPTAPAAASSPPAGTTDETDLSGPRSPRAAGRPATATDADRPPARGATAPAGPTPIERPSTGDAAEDSYLYGYRLWEAKRYPEAQVALKRTVADFPKSRRASYAQNLLGRAYLDDGKPSLASMAFYDNYKKMPDGERAPESLYYLGQALQKLNKPADACKVYDELNDVYAGKISAQMQANVARGRTAAKCK